jgi:adenosine 3'-phospho 5'-phosphosulfate transporter B3
MQTLSIRYLNFPTVVIFKSAKLLPVMLVNAVWLGRRQQPLDVAAALMLCLGLGLFSVSDSKLHPDFHPKGVFLVLCSVCADACISNLQEATMRSRNTPVLEMVLFSHTFALALLLPAAAVGGELTASFWWLFMNPNSFGLMVLFCICGFFGELHFCHHDIECPFFS